MDNDEEQKSKREELRRKLLEGKDIVIGKKPSPFREWYDDKREESKIRIPQGKITVGPDFFWQENFLIEKLLMLTKYPQFTFLELFGYSGWEGYLDISIAPESNNNCKLMVFYHYDDIHTYKLEGINRRERRTRIYLIRPNVDDLCEYFGVEKTMARIRNAGFVVGKDKDGITYLEKAPTKLIGYEDVPFCAPFTIRGVEDLLKSF